jgi:transcriptional regulator with XRE-family HTH domain
MTKKVNISTDPDTGLDGISAALSTRMKTLRANAGLTLDALSKRSGVSKGMLVEIEKGTANPSIGTLCKVAAAFGMSVADIVSVAQASPVRHVAGGDIPTLWTGSEGGSARLLAGTSGPDMIELWRWVMRPGESYESQGHPAGTMELFHVEKGELHLVVGGTTLVLPKGDSAIARTDVPHRYANEGKTELVFTMTVAELHRRG